MQNLKKNSQIQNRTYWEKIDEDNEYIMKRMHPIVIFPGLFIGLMALVGSIFKVYMGW
mgnify:CR=1 FL=1